MTKTIENWFRKADKPRMDIGDELGKREIYHRDKIKYHQKELEYHIKKQKKYDKTLLEFIDHD